jgi:fused signal recognition particle receptor
VAWLPPPELEIGEEPELKPLELEPEFVELEPVEPEPVELEPVELEPVEPELAEPELVPELAEPEPDEELDEPDEVEPELLDALVLCVEPGRARASAPAVTTLAMVTAVVVDRTLARPRSLAAWASRIPLSRRALLMSLILRSRTRKSLHETSGSAMNRLALLVRAGRGYRGNMKVT